MNVSFHKKYSPTIVTLEFFRYLLHDPVNLAILGVNFLAHVQGHVAQISDDAAHLLQVLIHLILSRIIRHPGAEQEESGGLVTDRRLLQLRYHLLVSNKKLYKRHN